MMKIILSRQKRQSFKLISLPSILLLREGWFRQVQSRGERILALAGFVIAGMLIEHGHFVTQRFLQEEKKNALLSIGR